MVRIRLSTGFLIALAVWLGAEILAFIAVVYAAGLTGAILLGLLTTFAGIALLRQLGHGVTKEMRRALQGEPLGEEALLDGTLAAFGALLLILPGFLSDIIGFALAAPSIRQWFARRFGAAAPPKSGANGQASDILELSPEDWKVVDEGADKKPRGSGTHPL
jgi:UPF0716 protein FxsA